MATSYVRGFNDGASLVKLTRRDLLGGALKAAPAFALSTLLLQEGCTPASAADLVKWLDLATLAIQSALPVLSIADPALTPILGLVGAYLNLANNAADQTALELANAGDSATIQAQKISAYWVAVVLDPIVLAKLPMGAQNLVTAVTNAIANFLKALQVLLTQAGVAAGHVAGGPQLALKLSASLQEKVARVRSVSAINRAVLMARPTQ